MKIKSSVLTLSLLIAGVMSSNAAIFLIANPVTFTDDTLYATLGNNPMVAGTVTIGYFGSTITDSNIDTIPELFANLGGFTIQSSFVPGSVMGTYAFGAPGYADNSDASASMGQINLSSNAALLGRTVYSIVSSAANLGTALLTDQFALVKIGTIGNDEAGELSYSSNPAGITPMIGTKGTLTTDLGIDFDGPGGEPGLGSQTYSTLKMAVVPEPSAALLGALGALGLLRRRRN